MNEPTFTIDGITHGILNVIELHVRAGSYTPDQKHLLPSCGEIFLGVIDDPPKKVTCVLCISGEP